MKPVIYILFLIIAVKSSVYCQTFSDTTYLKEVNVIASSDNYSGVLTTTLLDSSTINNPANTSLSSLISENTHVFIKSYGQGTLSTASFRGTSASHTQVQWNGIELNNPMLGQVDFSLIPTFFIDNVTLYHGGSSLHCGKGALGGTISIKNGPKWNKKIYGEIIQSYGSFSTWQSGLKIGGGSSKFQNEIRLYRESSKNNFIYQNTANSTSKTEHQDNADYLHQGVLYNLYFIPLKQHRISVNVWYQQSNRNIPPLMSYEGVDKDEYQNDENLFATAKWDFFFKSFSSQFKTSISHSSLDYYLGESGNSHAYVNSKSNIDGFFNNYALKWKSKKLSLRSKINYDHQFAQYNNQLDSSGYHAMRYDAGISVELSWNINNNITALGLIRESYTDNILFQPSVSSGIKYAPFANKHLILNANLSNNHHLPTLNDLYWIPGGNHDLKQENGITADMGMTNIYQPDPNLLFKLKLTVFYSRIDDWISWEPGENSYWTAQNIDLVVSRGLECYLKINYSFRKLKTDFNAIYAYTKSNNVNEFNNQLSPIENQLIYTPIHKTNTYLTINYIDYYLTISYLYTGKRLAISGGENGSNIMPAVNLNDIQTGKKIKIGTYNAQLSFKVSNVFNVNYQMIMWRAMPGRSYLLSFKFTL